MLGVNDLADKNAETPEIVAARIRARARLRAGGAARGGARCGMKYLPRAVAFAKMKALADGAAIVRREMEGN